MTEKYRIPSGYNSSPIGKLLGVILIVAALSASAFSSARALEPAFQYVRFEEGRIFTRLVEPDSLPAELIGYINKGVPIAAEYTIELWRARASWFDGLAEKISIDYRIRFDPWEKEYAVVRSAQNLVIENILDDEDEAIEMLTSSGQVAFSNFDSLAEYYLTGSLVIKTMSFSNFREVESWLKGEVSDIKKPNLEDAPEDVGEFIFNLALKISGLKSHSGDTQSGIFIPSRLKTDGVIPVK
jgi:hypothetical protein